MINENDSDTLLEESFDFELYWNKIRAKLHIIIFITLVFVVGTWITSSMKVPNYMATGVLLIQPDNNIMDFTNRFVTYDLRNEYYNTQIQILNNERIIGPVLEEIGLMHNGATGSLAIEPVESTRLVRINYTSPDPVVAAKFVNMLMDNFINFNVELRSQAFKQATEFISRQIKKLSTSLSNKERELQEYGQRKDLFFLSQKESTIVEKFADVNKAYTQAQINRINQEALYQELKNMKFEDYSEVKNDTLINNLKGQYSLLEAEYKRKSLIFKESYPEMQQLTSQMETLRGRIQEEIREKAGKILKQATTNYQSAVKREKSIFDMLDKQKKDMISSNTDAIYYKSLDIEVNNMRNLQNYLVRRQEESSLSSRLEGYQTSNIKIINRAKVPLAPLGTGKIRRLILALILGLSVSIGLIFFLDFLDRSIKNPDEVEALLNLPSLGVIPNSKSKRASRGHYYNYNYEYGAEQKDAMNENEEQVKDIELINFLDPKSFYAESYRSIRTSILLSTPKESPRVICVSSALQSEGKTVTAANLAISFSTLGKSVLIIDGDLRKPRLHKIFKLENKLGLTNYLVGRTSAEEIIQRTNIPGLYVITSGPIPPNPVELIDSELMVTLLAKLKGKLDFIFLDSPPLIGLVDPVLLGKNSDGVILVVWGGKTNRELIRKASQEFDRYKIRTIGIVLNKVDIKKRFGYSGYNYS
jgi:capsular exopolysaccharide synthesis family protein